MKMNYKTLSVSLLALAAAASAGYAVGEVRQPHMERALGELQGARTELNQATHDKGGHRGHAVQLVDEAIGEVRAGIAAGQQYDARHMH